MKSCCYYAVIRRAEEAANSCCNPEWYEGGPQASVLYRSWCPASSTSNGGKEVTELGQHSDEPFGDRCETESELSEASSSLLLIPSGCR